MALGLHELTAFYPQLHPGEGVYDIVNAGVAGLPAAEEGAVGGVDNGVTAQGGDIPLPEHQTGVGGRRRERISVCDPPFPDHLPQIFVLNVQKLRGGWVGRADVKQRPQKPPLSLAALRNPHLPVLGHLPLQSTDQIKPSLFLIHVDPPSFRR